ncbi:tyrosine-protein phosphatase non-receptor type substrate 1-like [Athene cunicularia]|uniref:tyrosine-protein phosphatase non-receptor type substrate 1-like n=1 Tax=Athene cunicularia TaxID=194338 RepID=UPI000EF74A41|nr:tyrosine-protein phosphatase non-receptor type substrate 1-like [Athene cunicularia]
MGIPTAPATRALPLACLMLLLLRRASGVSLQTGQSFKLHQPQDKVSVAAGDTLTLTCTVSTDGPLGPVKWLKAWGSRNETVYEQTGSFPRVTRVVSGSDADFSIRISDVRPEDVGTYYCVKFRTSLRGDVEFRRGKGTEVSVYSVWPLTDRGFELHQPQDKVSVAAGDTLTLTCTVSTDGPLGPVKWLKAWGSRNETVYEQTGSFPRVTRVVSPSDTDFSIRISDVRPEDAGTYYCVKFSKSLAGEEVFRHGKGTEVSVHGEWGSLSCSW